MREVRLFILFCVALVCLAGINSEATARKCNLGVVQARFNRKIPELKTYVIAHNQKTDDCYMYVYDGAKNQGSFITMPLGAYCLPAGEAKPLSLKYLREELRNPAVEVNSRSWREVRGLLGITFNKRQSDKPALFQITETGQCSMQQIKEYVVFINQYPKFKKFVFIPLVYNPIDRNVIVHAQSEDGLTLISLWFDPDCTLDANRKPESGGIVIDQLEKLTKTPGVKFFRKTKE